MSLHALIDALSASDPQMSEAARRALLAEGESVLDELIEVIPRLAPRSLMKVISVLGAQPLPRCEAALLSLLSHDHNLIRLSVVQALGNFTSENACLALIEQLNSSDVLIQISAATSLGKLGNPLALEAMVAQLLRTPEPTVRYSIIRALGQLGDPRAVEVILRFADDPNHHVRNDVRRALERLGASLPPESSPKD
ncbi:MAG: HEAT repeat domain-containing protein [Anaerolineae bacterium]|nr:HEAT repeat domain-containing protein [Anaerolineae bacterium]MDW8173957.1 HEAT repeat domain-containing protein [Anaerolineae bacterium]